MPSPPHPSRRDAKHDVQHEQRAVGEGVDETHRRTGEAHMSQHPYAGHRDSQRHHVAPGARAGQCQHDRPEKFDRADRAQRQTINRQIETQVHAAEHHAQSHDVAARRGTLLQEITPWPSPHGEDQRGAGDPQPGDAEWFDAGKQQDGEGRAEVMKDRADDEVRVRRQPVAERNPC